MNKEEKKYVKIFPRFTQKIFIHGNQKFWPSRIFFFCFFFSSSSIPFTFPSFSLSADYLFVVIIELRIVGNRRCVDVTFVPSPNLIQIRVPIWCRKYPLLRRECWIFLVNFYRLGGGCGLTRTFYHANDFLHTDAAATDLCCHLSLSLSLSHSFSLIITIFFWNVFFTYLFIIIIFISLFRFRFYYWSKIYISIWLCAIQPSCHFDRDGWWCVQGDGGKGV